MEEFMLVCLGFNSSYEDGMDYAYFFGSGNCSKQALARIPFSIEKAIRTAKRTFWGSVKDFTDDRTHVAYFSWNDSRDFSHRYIEAPKAYSVQALFELLREEGISLMSIMHWQEVDAFDREKAASEIEAYHKYIVENPDGSFFPVIKPIVDEYLTNTVWWDILINKHGMEASVDIRAEVKTFATSYVAKIKALYEQYMPAIHEVDEKYQAVEDAKQALKVADAAHRKAKTALKGQADRLQANVELDLSRPATSTG